MEGEKNDLSTHLRWFRNRNRKNLVNGHQPPTRKTHQDCAEEHSLQLSSSSSASSWLQATLFDLDKKTQAMLNLIEEDDADSFAKRAEMYYKRRPQLIQMVQEFHRAHRSLAECYQLKNVSTTTTSSYCDHPPTTTSSSSASSEDDDVKSSGSSFCCSVSTDNDSLSSDPDEDQSQLKQEPEAASVAASDSREVDHEDVMVVGSKEMESLVEENNKLKEELMQKDEEKREVIRQLCFSLDFLRSENEDLIAMIMMTKNRQNHTSQ